jgi:gamma-glutamylcyclotransferase (GGCT)/AIG2-like uncharacterized protein YtfP
MSEEFLFVYGTLRSDIVNNRVDLLGRSAHFIAKGSIQGRLYEIEGYPGAILSTRPLDRVYGELYALSDASRVLGDLDAYEECVPEFPVPHEYRREQCCVSLLADNDKAVQAWVFLYNHSVIKREVIASGDYKVYQQQHRGRRGYE